MHARCHLTVGLVSFLLVTSSATSDAEPEEFDGSTEASSKISDKIRAIIEHYKSPDPIGLPIVNIPEPLPIPEKSEAAKYSKIVFKTSKVIGLSKFRIESIHSYLDTMEMIALISYEKLEIVGNCSIKYVLLSSEGEYNVTLKKPMFEGVAALSVSREGNLELSNLDLNVEISGMSADFKGRGMFGKVLDGVLGTMGTVIFNTMKPYLRKEFITNSKGALNEQLLRFRKTFPNSIPPLDMSAAWARKYLRDLQYDPFIIEDVKHSVGVINLKVKDISLLGAGTIHRAGNVSLVLQNNTIKASVNAATKRLIAKCAIEVSVRGFFPHTAEGSFTVEYIQIDAAMNQTLDLRNKPQLEKIQIKIGNLQLRMDGLGTIDYVLEILANVLPNILRYQIADTIEATLTKQIEDYLERMNVEELIEQNLGLIDEYTSPNRTYERDINFDPPEDDKDFIQETIDDTKLS